MVCLLLHFPLKEAMNTKELLNAYYKGLDQKKGWENTLTDDFNFIGGDMTKSSHIVGKQSYIEIINRLSKLFDHVEVKEMAIAGDNASVIANYDWKFPNGKQINGNVAEIWRAKNGMLDSLTIFFDTLTFQANTK
jgi:hypothetical protein